MLVRPTSIPGSTRGGVEARAKTYVARVIDRVLVGLAEDVLDHAAHGRRLGDLLDQPVLVARRSARCTRASRRVVERHRRRCPGLLRRSASWRTRPSPAAPRGGSCARCPPRVADDVRALQAVKVPTTLSLLEQLLPLRDGRACLRDRRVEGILLNHACDALLVLASTALHLIVASTSLRKAASALSRCASAGCASRASP